LQLRAHSAEETEGRVVNSGGSVLAATALASVRASARIAFGLGGRVPLYTDVNGEQIAESFSVIALLSLTFDAGDDHGHNGGHGDGHGKGH
jgi:hypothetical protein